MRIRSSLCSPPTLLTPPLLPLPPLPPLAPLAPPRPSTPTRRTVLPIGMRSLPELIARVFVCTFVAVFLLHAALQLFQQGVAQARARGAVRDP